ncbi:MAG TPA: hypothetical protein PKL73_16130 [Polyangiaceae bacterium]|nr:MAG: hypothetical protein BWY17_05177 [Deltaproteobacteria bacterium ADurb.Bin207]HNS98481.1 hypothetical protein [Polyangiaceae bacterium]HNZ25501.1 hypothetical protein [Polyangiaceae bacterium]HOD25497.1 hypothetical protein [Polyangiaceae bacterium]HOE51703.1 hypothetical protein [Polyangiaceae bacterium]
MKTLHKFSFYPLLPGLMAFVVAAVGCSSGSSSPSRDNGGNVGGKGGSGGSGAGGATGGTGGVADAGGEDVEGVLEAGPDREMPKDCIPNDMKVVCNPLTNEGCDTAAGEACEFGVEEIFVCFPPPNDVQEGGACNWEEGPWCMPTLICDYENEEDPTGVCRKPCCSNDDCGSKSCVPMDPEFGSFGTCQ